MHEHLRAFVEAAVESYSLGGPIYRIASPLEGGEAPLPAVAGGRFAELVEGGGHPLSLGLGDGLARTVVCIGVVEHLDSPRWFVDELRRIMARGGTLLLTCELFGPSGRPRKNLQPRQLRQLLDGLELVMLAWQGPDERPHTAYVVAMKPPLPEPVPRQTAALVAGLQERLGRLRSQERFAGPLRRLLGRFLGQRVEAKRSADFFDLSAMVELPPRDLLRLDAATPSRLDVWK